MTIMIMDSKRPVLLVSNKSTPNKLGSAIAHCIYEGAEAVEVRAVGAGAVNQAIKALTVARGYVANTGRDLIFRSGFETVKDNRSADSDGKMSAIVIFASVA